MLKKIMTGAVAALTLGGVIAASATPAAAYPHGGFGGYRGGGYYHGGRGYGTGAVVGAGLLGLAVGAAVSHPYYGGGYGYYGPGPYYGGYYGGGCYTTWRYDGWGHRFPVERCY